MRHSFHTAKQYPDNKHKNRNPCQSRENDTGHTVTIMQFVGQETKYLASQPHSSSQYSHFVIDMRLKSHLIPVIRKERVEQTEKKSHEHTESNQHIHSNAPHTELFPGIGIERYA